MKINTFFLKDNLHFDKEMYMSNFSQKIETKQQKLIKAYSRKNQHSTYKSELYLSLL